MQLKDQVALVTGGSRGIGRGIAEAFAREGARVAVVYKGSKEAADAAVAAITQAGGSAIALQCDVTSADAAEACVKQVKEAFGGLHILVNNAGIIKDELFIRMEPESWNSVLQTNLGGAFNFCK